MSLFDLICIVLGSLVPLIILYFWFEQWLIMFRSNDNDK